VVLMSRVASSPDQAFRFHRSAREQSDATATKNRVGRRGEHEIRR
jgi:hypothetical protein